MGKLWNRIRTDLRQYRAVIAALGIYYILTRLVFHAFCPMVILTGLPCSGCGMSRAVWFLLTLQVDRSLAMHPLAGFWVLFVFCFAIERYIMGKQPTRVLMAFLTLLSVATLLFYLYRMAVLFPAKPPMSYTGHNILERLIPDYRQKIFAFFRYFR